MNAETLDLSVGAYVVYPYHGIATVDRVEKRPVDGQQTECLVVRVAGRGWDAVGDMIVSIPVDRAEEIGVRAPITREEADEVLEVLSQTDVRVPANWSRRFKNHQEKLRSGEVYNTAEVVRNLAHREMKARLSAAEKRMYDRARYALVSELAISWSLDIDEAEARVDEAVAQEE